MDEATRKRVLTGLNSALIKSTDIMTVPPVDYVHQRAYQDASEFLDGYMQVLEDSVADSLYWLKSPGA